MSKLNMPQFWYSSDENSKSPIMAKTLTPLAKLYEWGGQFNRAITREKQSPIPVICIGNLTMGGAGKTPTARAILDLVREHGKFMTPCFLMRGYGGREKGPIEVDTTQHTTWNVGDEALMQAQYAPVIVSADRYKGAQLAKASGYDLIIMDDGFQNPKLKKDLSFIVVDGGFGFGNECCFPAGPLREPISNGLARTDAAVVINRTEKTDLSALKNIKQFDGKIILDDGDIDEDNEKVVAFAGIARPEKFFQTLEDNGYKIHAHFSFPDHHVFTHGQLSSIVARAEKAYARLITTEKDWIRLSNRWHDKITPLTIHIELDENFKEYLFKHLDRLS